MRRADLSALRRAIASLPPQQRDAVVLREFAGCATTSSQRRSASREPAVESLLFRARTQLRAKLRAAYASVTGASVLEWLVRAVAGGTPVAAKVAVLGVEHGRSDGLGCSHAGCRRRHRHITLSPCSRSHVQQVHAVHKHARRSHTAPVSAPVRPSSRRVPAPSDHVIARRAAQTGSGERRLQSARPITEGRRSRQNRYRARARRDADGAFGSDSSGPGPGGDTSRSHDEGSGRPERSSGSGEDGHGGGSGSDGSGGADRERLGRRLTQAAARVLSFIHGAPGARGRPRDARRGRASAERGDGRAVFVTGEPGIGKTSLVERFVPTSAGDARVLVGRCDDLSIPRPLGPFRDLASDAAPALAEALRSGAPPHDVQALLLAELEARPHPTVLVVEDVHWADDATLDTITVVGRRIRSLPALLVLTFRSGEAPPGHLLRTTIGAIRAEDTATIELAPLSAEAVVSLAGDVADAGLRR